MADIGTLQDHIDDLMIENRKLRQERDHYRRALQYLAKRFAIQLGDKAADDVFDDAMFETCYE